MMTNAVAFINMAAFAINSYQSCQSLELIYNVKNYMFLNSQKLRYRDMLLYEFLFFYIWQYNWEIKKVHCYSENKQIENVIDFTQQFNKQVNIKLHFRNNSGVFFPNKSLYLNDLGESMSHKTVICFVPKWISYFVQIDWINDSVIQ